MFRFLTISSVVFGCLVTASHVRATTWDVLVKTGDIVPGTLGEAFFQHFEWPAIAENGDTVFGANLGGPITNQTNNYAYIRATPSGELSLIARQGMPLEIGRDTRLNETRLRGVTADGRIMLTGEISGSARDYVRAWTFSEGEVYELMRSLTPSGREDGSQWRQFEGTVADSGLVVGRLRLFSEDENKELDTGLWWSPDGFSTGSMLIREGDPLPGLDPSFRLGEIGHVAVNRSGHFVIATEVRRPDVPNPGFSTLSNLLSYSPETGWSEIAGQFSPVPDTPGATFQEYSFPTLNDHGYVGFTALENGVSAWVVDPNGEFRRIATHNDPAPVEGELIRLDLPGNEVVVDVDSAGRAALVAELFGGQSQLGRHVVLQSIPGEDVQVVVRGGLPVPDRFNLRFGDPEFNSGIFDVTLSDSGIGIVSSLVFPAPTDGTGSGLFAFDRDGTITTLIAAGDEVEVAPGDIRVVQTAWMTPDEHSTALTGIANDGTLTLLATFTDQSQAVLRTRLIPEPATSLNLAIGFMMLLIAKRKAPNVAR